MTPALTFALVLLLFVAWVALPFVPAILELLRPRDAVPLDAVGQDSGELRFFATSFTQRLLSAGFDSRSVQELLPDGTRVRVHRAGEPMQALTAPESARTDFIAIVDALPIAERAVLEKEAYATGDIRVGSGASVRALLGEHAVYLGTGARVLRWVHACDTLHVARGTSLFGRATSDEAILLEESVGFERMEAPVVRVLGRDVDEAPLLPASAYTPFVPRDATLMAPAYWRVDGDVAVPAGSTIVGSLVATGSITIGESARAEGAFKAHGQLRVCRNAIVVGAVAARGAITVDDGAHLSGPVISETSACIGAATVGVAGRRTTVVAPRVTLHAGATVYGAVMSVGGGETGPGQRDGR